MHTSCGRQAGLHLTVQIHVLERSAATLASGAAPHLLEPLANDSTLRSTKLVIVHGGWPLVGEAQALLGRPNVYADISMMDVFLPPRSSPVLRQWLNE